MDNFQVSWFDDPNCIDISTKDRQLLYKITFFINTGIIQAQGINKGKFVKNYFTKLLQIVI